MSDPLRSAIPYRWAFLALLACATLVRALAAAAIPLSGDEAYYWEYARHLSAGYHDHPPMVGWIVAASVALFGHGTFAIRAPFVLMATALAWFLHDATREATGSERAAFWGGALPLAIPLFSVAGIAVFPDSSLLFATSVFLWSGWRALRGDGRGWWLLLGAAAGMAGLCKLTGLYLLPALFVALVLFPDWRRWLRSWEPWLAVGVALVVFSPFLYWNATHQWESFAYQYGSRMGRASGLGVQHLRNYAVLSLAALSPILAVLLAWAAAQAGWRGIFRREPAPAWFFCVALPIHLVFLGLSLLVKIGLHWAAPGTLAACCALGWWVDAFAGRVGRLLAWMGLALAFLISGVVFTAVFSPATIISLVSSGVQMAGVNKNEPLTVNEMAEIFGYPAGGRYVHQTAEQLRAKGSDPFIMTTNYALSSALALYSGERLHVIMGTSIGAEYDRWDDFPSMLGRDALYVDTSAPWKREDVWRHLTAAFERLEPLPPHPTEAKGVGSRTFYAVWCRNFRTDVFTPLKASNRR